MSVEVKKALSLASCVVKELDVGKVGKSVEKEVSVRDVKRVLERQSERKRGRRGNERREGSQRKEAHCSRNLASKLVF